MTITTAGILLDNGVEGHDGDDGDYREDDGDDDENISAATATVEGYGINLLMTELHWKLQDAEW